MIYIILYTNYYIRKLAVYLFLPSFIFRGSILWFKVVKTIQLSIKILKIHYIDIFDENSKFNKLLLKFYGHPEYIQILLGITIDTYERIKIKDIDTQKFQEIMKFIKFFENKEKIEKMKDKELIKMIKNEMDKVNETTTTNNCNEFDFEIDDIIKLQN